MRSPILQATGSLGILLLFLLFDLATHTRPEPGGHSLHNTPWVFVLAIGLFYALFNALFGLRTEKPVRYIGQSIYAYVGLLLAGSLLAWLFSGLTMDEAGSFRWLFVVLTMGYVVFIVISRLMKRIVEIAIRQDDKLRGE